jgi:hypothetical protein
MNIEPTIPKKAIEEPLIIGADGGHDGLRDNLIELSEG